MKACAMIVLSTRLVGNLSSRHLVKSTLNSSRGVAFERLENAKAKLIKKNAFSCHVNGKGINEICKETMRFIKKSQQGISHQHSNAWIRLHSRRDYALLVSRLLSFQVKKRI